GAPIERSRTTGPAVPAELHEGRTDATAAVSRQPAVTARAAVARDGHVARAITAAVVTREDTGLARANREGRGLDAGQDRRRPGESGRASGRQRDWTTRGAVLRQEMVWSRRITPPDTQ